MAGMPVIAVRPEPGLAATLAAARAMGFDAQGFALFMAEPVTWQAPEPSSYAGLLAGSGNVFRHGGPGLAALAALPVFAVGEATTAAARKAGFAVAATGSGGLQALVQTLAPGRYLRLSGEAHVALDPPAGVEADTLVTYRMAARPFPPALADLLRSPALVLLHSGEAARHFAAQCDAHAIARGAVALACLAPRIAEAAGTGWARVESAAQPSDPVLLELAMQMCQTG
ncbi:MAG: uroporphyrinogen-III synthase [Sphingomonadales bacterium]|nr:uroporphyrinogen-III synthase [Sphingomonadales bacterium]MDE2569739.1 uroporphyrinogen-III synthase [Sphingomonadales bacterium]